MADGEFQRVGGENQKPETVRDGGRRGKRAAPEERLGRAREEKLEALVAGRGPALEPSF